MERMQYRGRMQTSKKKAYGGPTDPPTKRETYVASTTAPQVKDEVRDQILSQLAKPVLPTRADLYPESEAIRMNEIQKRNNKRIENQVAGEARMKVIRDSTMRVKGFDPNSPEDVEAYYKAVRKEARKPNVAPEYAKFSKGIFDSGPKKVGQFIYGCSGSNANGGRIDTGHPADSSSTHFKLPRKKK